MKKDKKQMIEKFEKMLDADNPDGFRVSTQVEPRLADAEKVKQFISTLLKVERNKIIKEILELKEGVDVINEVEVGGFVSVDKLIKLLKKEL